MANSQRLMIQIDQEFYKKTFQNRTLEEFKHDFDYLGHIICEFKRFIEFNLVNTIDDLGHCFNRCMYIVLYASDQDCRAYALKLLKLFNTSIISLYIDLVKTHNLPQLDASLLQELVNYCSENHGFDFNYQYVNSLINVH